MKKFDLIKEHAANNVRIVQNIIIFQRNIMERSGCNR